MWLLKRTVYGLSGPNVVKLVAMEFKEGRDFVQNPKLLKIDIAKEMEVRSNHVI